MKLTNLRSKTAIEVSDNDLLLIEDKEDTKTVTVGQFKTLMASYSKIQFKKLFNEGIDGIIASLEKSKFIIPKECRYLVNTWIGSASGNIQITLKDLSDNHWLTRDELVALIMDEDGAIVHDFEMRLFAGGVYHTPKAYQVLNFVDHHERSANEWLYDSNAGFIKASYENLTQNLISGIRAHDIEVILKNRTVTNEDETQDEFSYTFITDVNSFANSVPYVEDPLNP